MTEKDLLNLKEKINDAKDDVNKLTGRKEHLMQQLEDDWDCESLAEAKTKLKDYKEEIKTLDNKIKEGTEALEEKYGDA